MMDFFFFLSRQQKAARVLVYVCVVMWAAVGCGSSDSQTTTTSDTTQQSTSDATQQTSSDGGDTADTTSLQVDRGPTSLLIDGDPNGLWWDATQGVLYIADDNGNRLLRWTDAGFQDAILLPNATGDDGPGLGQVVQTADGTLAVTRFGFGTRGDVVTVSPDGQGAVVPNLDPMRRRIGMTVAADGSVYVGWFTGSRTDRIGGVSRIDLKAGGEVDLDATGLLKVVGVLAGDGVLYVSDQDESRLYSVSTNGGSPQLIGSPPSADLLTHGPDNTLFTGGKAGEVYQISLAGDVTTVQGGFQEVRGLAYDAANQRLFVVDHDTDESDGFSHRLHILPIGGAQP